MGEALDASMSVELLCPFILAPDAGRFEDAFVTACVASYCAALCVIVFFDPVPVLELTSVRNPIPLNLLGDAGSGQATSKENLGFNLRRSLRRLILLPRHRGIQLRVKHLLLFFLFLRRRRLRLALQKIRRTLRRNRLLLFLFFLGRDHLAID
jgi:hypothetical protein